MLLFSTIVLGIALLSMAYVAMQVIWMHDKQVMDNIVPILMVVGLTYIVGWLVALVAIRLFHNLILPYLINLYAWGTVLGILVLYTVIMQRLYWQLYDLTSFIKYVVVMAAAFAALLGFHLLVKDHSLRPFAAPLIAFILIHMTVIVFHYVFAGNVNYDKLKYDVTFFFGMAAIGTFMMAHVGVLAGTRSAIDRIFEKDPNGEEEKTA